MLSSVRFEPGKHEATVSMVCFRGKQLSSWLIKSTCKFDMLVRRSFMVLARRAGLGTRLGARRLCLHELQFDA